MPKLRVIAEEKSVYGVGRVDDGNWFSAQVTGNKGKSWGTLEMPLSLLPSALARRAVTGQDVHIRLTVAQDGERRVRNSRPNVGALEYQG